MELNRLTKENVIPPSRWEAPIVPIIKRNGAVRLCGDFKVTVNLVSPIDRYPLPKISLNQSNQSPKNKFC